MESAEHHIDAALAAIVTIYRGDADMQALQARLASFAPAAPADALMRAVEPFRDLPEVTGPLYERVVVQRPHDARALVILANAYWLAGRGPELVGQLASRAISADPRNRGAWHLWALTEGEPRARVTRWQQVALRFPDDQLARANLADNAASLAGAEHDPVALALALETYAHLLAETSHPAQRAALQTAITTLERWRL